MRRKCYQCFSEAAYLIKSSPLLLLLPFHFFFQRNNVSRTNHPHPPDFLLVLPNLPRHLLLPRSLERRRSEGVAQTEQHAGADQNLGAGCVFPGGKGIIFYHYAKSRGDPFPPKVHE